MNSDSAEPALALPSLCDLHKASASEKQSPDVEPGGGPVPREEQCPDVAEPTYALPSLSNLHKASFCGPGSKDEQHPDAGEPAFALPSLADLHEASLGRPGTGGDGCPDLDAALCGTREDHYPEAGTGEEDAEASFGGQRTQDDRRSDLHAGEDVWTKLGDVVASALTAMEVAGPEVADVGVGLHVIQEEAEEAEAASPLSSNESLVVSDEACSLQDTRKEETAGVNGSREEDIVEQQRVLQNQMSEYILNSLNDEGNALARRKNELVDELAVQERMLQHQMAEFILNSSAEAENVLARSINGEDEVLGEGSMEETDLAKQLDVQKKTLVCAETSTSSASKSNVETYEDERMQPPISSEQPDRSFGVRVPAESNVQTWRAWADKDSQTETEIRQERLQSPEREKKKEEFSPARDFPVAGRHRAATNEPPAPMLSAETLECRDRRRMQSITHLHKEQEISKAESEDLRLQAVLRKLKSQLRNAILSRDRNALKGIQAKIVELELAVDHFEATFEIKGGTDDFHLQDREKQDDTAEEKIGNGVDKEETEGSTDEEIIQQRILQSQMAEFVLNKLEKALAGRKHEVTGSTEETDLAKRRVLQNRMSRYLMDLMELMITHNVMVGTEKEGEQAMPRLGPGQQAPCASEPQEREWETEIYLEGDEALVHDNICVDGSKGSRVLRYLDPHIDPFAMDHSKRGSHQGQGQGQALIYQRDSRMMERSSAFTKLPLYSTMSTKALHYDPEVLCCPQEMESNEICGVEGRKIEGQMQELTMLEDGRRVLMFLDESAPEGYHQQMQDEGSFVEQMYMTHLLRRDCGNKEFVGRRQSHSEGTAEVERRAEDEIDVQRRMMQSQMSEYVLNSLNGEENKSVRTQSLDKPEEQEEFMRFVAVCREVLPVKDAKGKMSANVGVGLSTLSPIPRNEMGEDSYTGSREPESESLGLSSTETSSDRFEDDLDRRIEMVERQRERREQEKREMRRSKWWGVFLGHEQDRTPAGLASSRAKSLSPPRVQVQWEDGDQESSKKEERLIGSRVERLNRQLIEENESLRAYVRDSEARGKEMQEALKVEREKIACFESLAMPVASPLTSREMQTSIAQRMHRAAESILRIAALESHNSQLQQELTHLKQTQTAMKQQRVHHHQKLVRQTTERLLVHAWECLSCFVEQQKRLQDKVHNVMQQYLGRTMVFWFREWLKGTRHRKKMRSSTTKAVYRLTNLRILRAYGRWHSSASKQKRLRDVTKTVVRRLFRRRLGDGFEMWTSYVEGAKHDKQQQHREEAISDLENLRHHQQNQSLLQIEKQRQRHQQEMKEVTEKHQHELQEFIQQQQIAALSYELEQDEWATERRNHQALILSMKGEEAKMEQALEEARAQFGILQHVSVLLCNSVIALVCDVSQELGDQSAVMQLALYVDPLALTAANIRAQEEILELLHTVDILHADVKVLKASLSEDDRAAKMLQKDLVRENRSIKDEKALVVSQLQNALQRIDEDKHKLRESLKLADERTRQLEEQMEVAEAFKKELEKERQERELEREEYERRELEWERETKRKEDRERVWRVREKELEEGKKWLLQQNAEWRERLQVLRRELDHAMRDLASARGHLAITRVKEQALVDAESKLVKMELAKDKALSELDFIRGAAMMAAEKCRVEMEKQALYPVIIRKLQHQASELQEHKVNDLESTIAHLRWELDSSVQLLMDERVRNTSSRSKSLGTLRSISPKDVAMAADNIVPPDEVRQVGQTKTEETTYEHLAAISSSPLTTIPVQLSRRTPSPQKHALLAPPNVCPFSKPAIATSHRSVSPRSDLGAWDSDEELVKGLNSHTMEKQSSQVDEEYLQKRVEQLSNDASQWLSFFSQTPSPESTPSQTFPESATEHSTVSPKISVLEQETAPRVSWVMEGAATASRRPQTTVEREQEEDFVKSEKLERAKQYAEEGTEKHLQEHVQVEAMKKTTANMKNFWKSLEAQSSTPASIKQDDSPSRETGQRMAAGTGEKKTIIDAVETGEATTDLDAAGQTRIVEEAKGESSPVWKAGQSLKSPGAVHVSRGIIPREIIHVSNRVELSPPKEALSNSLNWNQAKQGPDDERNIVLEEPTRHFQGPAKEDIASSSTVGLDLIGSRNSSCEKVLAGKDLGASEGMDVHPERQAQAFDDSMAERKHKPNTLDVEALHKSDMIRLYIHGEEQEMRSTGDDQAEIEWAEACHASDDEFEKVDEDEVGPSLLSDSLASATESVAKLMQNVREMRASSASRWYKRSGGVHEGDAADKEPEGTVHGSAGGREWTGQGQANQRRASHDDTSVMSGESVEECNPMDASDAAASISRHQIRKLLLR